MWCRSKHNSVSGDAAERLCDEEPEAPPHRPSTPTPPVIAGDECNDGHDVPTTSEKCSAMAEITPTTSEKCSAMTEITPVDVSSPVHVITPAPTARESPEPELTPVAPVAPALNAITPQSMLQLMQPIEFPRRISSTVDSPEAALTPVTPAMDTSTPQSVLQLMQPIIVISSVHSTESFGKYAEIDEISATAETFIDDECLDDSVIVEVVPLMAAPLEVEYVVEEIQLSDDTYTETEEEKEDEEVVAEVIDDVITDIEIIAAEKFIIDACTENEGEVLNEEVIAEENWITVVDEKPPNKISRPATPLKLPTTPLSPASCSYPEYIFSPRIQYKEKYLDTIFFQESTPKTSIAQSEPCLLEVRPVAAVPDIRRRSSTPDFTMSLEVEGERPTLEEQSAALSSATSDESDAGESVEEITDDESAAAGESTEEDIKLSTAEEISSSDYYDDDDELGVDVSLNATAGDTFTFNDGLSDAEDIVAAELGQENKGFLDGSDSELMMAVDQSDLTQVSRFDMQVEDISDGDFSPESEHNGEYTHNAHEAVPKTLTQEMSLLTDIPTICSGSDEEGMLSQTAGANTYRKSEWQVVAELSQQQKEESWHLANKAMKYYKACQSNCCFPLLKGH